MKQVKLVCAVLMIAVLSGCATGLNSMQKREYAAMKLDDVVIEEKNPSLGLALGLLPGFGSFYAREPGYGILNLLLWPASILWDPISGHQGSEAINYELTKHYLKKEQQSAIAALDDKLMTEEINSSEYVQEKNKIEQKFSY